ncbi:GGDEF domain-containing protein [Planctobacterium marinum]|uniref:GGDEF domain-containing protein n=1 Tax=Planctobacterium marinum TaxID=1631968 RepID=UPI001E2BC7ED|nr:GGDEF domain-containing protein [Planctobacterium marinum]MCC2604934.1 diguanylate cyclase [Planctobacterium marinum]
MMKNEPAGLLNSLGIAIIGCNQYGLITFLNQNAEVVTGLNHTAAFGTPISNLVGFKFENEIRKALIQLDSLNSAQKQCPPLLTRDISFPSQHLTMQGTMIPVYDNAGTCNGFVIALHQKSIDDSHSEETYYRANYDLLTGLPNRFLLIDRIQFAMNLAKRQSTQIGLLFLDLDSFKLVNDSLGHLIGDKLLQSVAKRIINCIRSSDSVGRYGGDEFLVLLNEVASLRDCEQVAEKILSSFCQPHRLNSKSVIVTVSIGISTFPGDADSEESLIDHADKAMYIAKRKGQNRFEFYK